MKIKFSVFKLTKILILKGSAIFLFILIIFMLLVSPGFFNHLKFFDFDSTTIPELSTELEGRTIGVDPGHGGYDPGFFVGEVKECDIVLEISLKLQRLLEQSGAKVVMTRDEDIDLWDYVPKNNEDAKKQENDKKKTKAYELENRVKILEGEGAELILSVHANSIPSKIWSGAQTFYQQGDEDSRLLANYIQDNFIETLKNTERSALGGDYFMLRESTSTGTIIEVGFLSNPKERELLQDEIYQERVSWAIYLGLLEYLTE